MHVIKVQFKLAEARKTSLGGHSIIVIRACPNVSKFVHGGIPTSELMRSNSLNSMNALFSSLSDLNSTMYFFTLKMCDPHHLMVLYVPGLNSLTQFGKMNQSAWSEAGKDIFLQEEKEVPHDFINFYGQQEMPPCNVQVARASFDA